MARIWTDAQSAAINTRDKELLICAAAGSGKTATLTERIIRSLTVDEPPRDISKMLIVTFTRAAAAELRERIYAALSEALATDPNNRHLSSQLVKIGGARICTIDSFYLDLVREHFSALGLPPTFRIADTAECELIAKEIMSETVNAFYDKDIDTFSHFAEAFTGIRNGGQLPEILIDLYSHISSYPEGIAFLRISAEETADAAKGNFFDSRFGAVLRKNAAERAEYLVSVSDSLLSLIYSRDEVAVAYSPAFEYLNNFSHTLARLLDEGDYDSVRAHLSSYESVRLKSVPAYKLDEEIAEAKELRTALADEIKSLAKKSFSLSSENISRELSETAAITATLFELLADFESKFNAEKLSRGILEFNDVRRYAMKLLVDEHGEPTETAVALSKQFTDIYIDEYQDVDRVQDMIFKSISNSRNRFIVGDIKQSIYGFRGAEPQVFAKYRSLFPARDSEASKDSQSESIFMSNNFRCDKNVIDFTNAVCSYLFGICSENIGYCSDDDLVYSKLPAECDEYISPKVALTVISPPESDEVENISDNNRRAEAKYIAGEIIRLVSNEKKADGKPIGFGDIAILMRSSSMKSYLARELEAAGIPFSGNEDKEYFENPEVLLVLSLLNSIDNPRRDIHLAATLFSPIFNFSFEELISLRSYRNSSYSLYDSLTEYAENESSPLAEKSKGFIRTLEAWKDMTLSMPVDKLIRRIFDSAEFSASSLALSDNLRLLYDFARRFESGAFRGLYSFIEYINKMISEGATFEGAANENTSDKVSLMSIHKSKGLEFPVCFVAGVGGEFNKSESRDSLAFDSQVGVAMKLPDGTGFARINTPMREAVLANISIARTEEEMRVLYVALTRARERLYVTANTRTCPEKLLADAKHKHRYSSRYSLVKSRSFLEWILAALSPCEENDTYSLSFIPADTVNHPVAISAIVEKNNDTRECDEALVEKLTEKFNYKYPYSAHSRIPAKISVSRLSPDVLDQSSDSKNLFEDDKTVRVPEILLGKRNCTPSATERGTATHLFLQFCNFERTDKTGVREELARLIEERFLPASAENAVFIEELEAFFYSELYEKIRTAKQVIREQRFNILMPAALFSTEPKFIAEIGDEMIAVQGVIDLIVIDADGKLCLYDYKTDRLARDELCNEASLYRKMNELHSLQLSYYKIAAEHLFDTTCSLCAIYSTHAGRVVSLKNF